MKRKQTKSDMDIIKVYQKLGLNDIAVKPYDRTLQFRNLQRFSLFTDNNHYYASGDTRTDR